MSSSIEVSDFHIVSKNTQPATDGETSRKSGKTSIFSNFSSNAKSKLMASLYNVVHSMPTEFPSFTDSTIYLLGKSYKLRDIKQEKAEAPDRMNFSYSGEFYDEFFDKSEELARTTTSVGFREFTIDFSNIIWFCYRKEFPPIEPSSITNDIGWGCMIRTGISIFCNNILTF
jgi:hypothetical protein